MKAAFALSFFLISVSVHAQQNPFTPRLDQLQPPPGQPICSDWYAEVALPKFGCHPDTIEKICSGQLPKVNSGPFCGDLEKAGYDTSTMGKTCQTPAGQCPIDQAGPLNAECYCRDIAQHMFKGWVVRP